MKRVYVVCLLIFGFAEIVSAQNTRMNIEIINTPDFSGYTAINNPSAKFDDANKGANFISLSNNHVFSYSFNIGTPQFTTLWSEYSTGKNKTANKYFSYTLFLTPGDDVTIQIDPNKKLNGVVVTGKGSNNNPPEIFALTDMDTQPFKEDALPGRVIAAINKQYAVNKHILNSYATPLKASEVTPLKPSEASVKNARLNLAYFAPRIYFEFSHNNMGWPVATTHKWDKVQDSLFRTIKLNNDDALASYNYTQLITNFVLREKERLWRESKSNPELFYKQWYHTNVADGEKRIKGEYSSILVEKIINKYFSGKTAEYLYADLLKGNMYRSNYQNITLLFGHFKKKYPASKYIAEFSGPVNEIAKRQNQALDDKMVFVANNGSKLNTLKDVLAITKGKTVLVDMWGTWCSPCREEIEKNSALLRASLKGKGVDFLYIANDDMKNEKEWKKLIAYYQMEGMHILANDKLNNDIMNKVKGTGYPTYFIIKKDGTFKQSKTQYPVNTQAMVKELESAAR